MNSLQKQATGSPAAAPETFVQTFEQKLLSAELPEVEITMKKLKFLGLNFDPFSQENTAECRQIMDNLGLTEHLTNPYLATNILLRLLDKTEERLNTLKQ